MQAVVDSFRVLFCRPAIHGFRTDRNEDRTIERTSLLSGVTDNSTVFWHHALEYMSVMQQSEKIGDELLTEVREALTRDDLKMGLCPNHA